MTRIVLSILLTLFTKWIIASPPNSILPPLPPVLKNVTVDNSASAVIVNWLPSPSPGVAGYVVYRFRNNEGYAIDTIRNPAATSFTDFESGALVFSEAYVVAAIDNEDNISPLSNSLSTIFLSATLDTCNNLIKFDWTGFNPQVSPVSEYEILGSDEGGDFVMVVSAGSQSLSSEWHDFKTGASYRFIVRARMDDNSSSESNMVFLDTDIPRPPDWIITAGIHPADHNRLNLSVIFDNQSEITIFRISRKELPDGEFLTAGIVNSGEGYFSFTDNSSDPAKRYLYIVDALNSCGNPALSSSPASNIVLEGSVSGYLINLKWNHFTGWDEEVTGYDIRYRKGSVYETIRSLPGIDTAYILDYSTIMYEVNEAETCFRIVPYGEFSGNPEYAVWSNDFCMATPSQLFIPNAFTPDGNGVNDTFGAVI
ncbi:MAG: hypothetical protein FJY11_06030, partial [Bacteroidetes bacterium]|nr:hypothetical protein [Bacteroidota bacterium]